MYGFALYIYVCACVCHKIPIDSGRVSVFRETFQLSGKYLQVILIDFIVYSQASAVILWDMRIVDVLLILITRTWQLFLQRFAIAAGGLAEKKNPFHPTYSYLILCTDIFYVWTMLYSKWGCVFFYLVNEKLKGHKKQSLLSNYYYIGYGDNQTMFGASFRHAILWI